MYQPQDRDHLVHHARLLFPGSAVTVTYDDEIIHLDIDGDRPPPGGPFGLLVH